MKFSIFPRITAALLCLTLLAGCAKAPATATTGQTDAPTSSTGSSVSTSSTSTTITGEPTTGPSTAEKVTVTPGIYIADDPARTLLIYDVEDGGFSVCFSSLLFDSYCMSIRATAELSEKEAVLTFQNEDPLSSYGGLLSFEEDGIHASLRRSAETTSDFTARYKLMRALPDGDTARPFSLSELLIGDTPFDLVTAEDADALYGQPVGTEEYEFYDDTAQRREYEGVSLDIYNTVFLALFTDPEFPAPRGVRVGDDWESVLARFPDAGGEPVQSEAGGLMRLLYGDPTYRQSYGELWLSDGGTPEYVIYADEGYTLTYILQDGKVSSVEFAVPTN